MKTTRYLTAVLSRQNVIKEFLVRQFWSLASWPRLLLEVWTRDEMGERYFSFSTAMFLVILLILLPFGIANFMPFVEQSYRNYPRDLSFWQMVGKHPLYYLYILAFAIMSFYRRQEMKRLPSVFDFARYSKSTGKVHPKLMNLNMLGFYFDIRTIQTIIEPLFFFVAGYVFSYLDSLLGKLIMDCAMLYSMSYFAAYHIGDEQMLDVIDDIIVSEELVNAIVKGKNPSDTRGFTIFGRRPSKAENRNKVANAMLGKDEFSEVD